MSDSAAPPRLRRVLRAPGLALYGLGTIIGAGIYVLVGKVAGHAGMYAPICFAVSAVVALLSGLSFAELSSRYPESAGEAAYVREGFHSRHLSTIVGVLVATSGVVSAATLCLGFHGYITYFVDLPHWLVISALVIALSALACWGIKESATAAVVITLVEVGGLLFIVAIAGDALGEIGSRSSELLPPPTVDAWTGIFLGAFLAFYAFIGFEDMVNVAEEVVEPERTMPRALLFALVGATILYLLVAVVAVLSLPVAELRASDAPLALIYQRQTGEAPWLIVAISAFSVLNGTLVQIVMSARVLYGLSERGNLPAPLARVNARTHTPVVATFVIGGAVLVLALSFRIEKLASATSFALLVVFGLVNLALWRISAKEPRPSSKFRVPRAVPLVAALFCFTFAGTRVAVALL